MVLPTAFTDLFSVAHPVALAPMGGCAGGALAAAVSNGGGLGLIGGGPGDRAWCERELAIAAERTERPWGIGFLTCGLTLDLLDAALARSRRRGCCRSAIRRLSPRRCAGRAFA